MSWAIIVPGNLIELFIIYKYWFSLLEPRYGKGKSITIYTIVSLINVIKGWVMFEHVTLRAFITTVISLLLMQILFKDKIYKKIVVHTIHILCAMLAEYLAFIFAKYVYNYHMQGFLEPTFPCFMWQATAYLFVFIFNIIAILLIKNKKINVDDRIMQFVFLYLSLQCLTCFVLSMLIFEYKITSLIMIVIIAVVLICSVAIGVFIYKSIRYATIKTLEAEYIKIESEIKDRRFMEIKNQYEEYKRLRHDFSNHLEILKNMKDSGKLLEYAGEIEEKFDSIKSVSYCDNLTLDALFALKKSEAVQKDINLEYEICSFNDIKIQDFDLCTVVSNMLDNGIEAAEKTTGRYVKLQINRKSGRLLIIMRNSSPDTDGNLDTTKEDTSLHGIGIKQIKSVTAKYDGDGVFRYENGEFISVINMVCE